MPTMEVIGNTRPPRSGAFEVTTDIGVILYSKLKSGSFPSPLAIVKAIEAGSGSASAAGSI
jgi:selT/selW/selH-like putative selenoprotein